VTHLHGYGNTKILAKAIESGDSKALLDTFTRAKAARDDYCEKNC
jgi:hypothetical protein